MPPPATRADVITFNGVRYRRYPNAKEWAERSYYVPGVADRQSGRGRLHEDIWKKANGPIPDGHDIHHADFDPLNNDLANLHCLTNSEHRELHRERGHERGTSPEALEHLARIRPMAAEWHRSPEGTEWHRAHAAAIGFGNAPLRDGICGQCGKPYQTKKPGGGDRFCSPACKAAWRRDSGVDDVQRTCAFCGIEFTVSRYNAKQCCGRVCAQRLRAGWPRPGVQSDGGRIA